MQSLRSLVSFIRAAELGSFAKAAREAGVSAAAVSQAVSRLEANLGVRLLARSTRQLRLTPEGEAFLDQCRQPMAQLDDACRGAASQTSEVSGTVRATVVSPVAFLYLAPLLPELLRLHPALSLQLELSEDAQPLIPKRFDVGIRVGPLADAAFVARPLGPLRMLLCASPDYLATHGAPATPEAIGGHAVLRLQVTGREQPTPLMVQTRLDGARNVQLLDVPGRFVCNDYRCLLGACLDGIGIAQLPQPLALPALRRGALRIVLPEHAMADLQLFLHYPSRKQLPARVRAFVDFCVEHLGGHPDLTADVGAFAA